MATRLYIDRDGFNPSPDSFTPSLQGSWGSDLTQTYCLAPAGHSELQNSTFLTRSVNTNSSAGTIAHAMCYSPPMQSTHTWDVGIQCGMMIRCKEASSTQNCYTQFYFGIISNDGANLRILFGFCKDNVEMATSLVSRINGSAYNNIVPSSYVSVPGDRIFCEIGWDKDGAVAGNISMQYGYSDSSGDLSGDGDSGVQNPYLDLPNVTITFDPEGTTYSTGDPNGLMLRGVGT